MSEAKEFTQHRCGKRRKVRERFAVVRVLYRKACASDRHVGLVDTDNNGDHLLLIESVQRDALPRDYGENALERS